MSRYMRFAVCAVLGFGVLAMILSSNSGPAVEPQPEISDVLAVGVDEPPVSAPVVEQKPVRPKTPKMSDQAKRARDRRAEEREQRSIQALDEERPDTDTVTVQKKS